MSAPSPTGPPPTGPTVDIRLIYGPLLVGVFFNMILYGVLIAQQLTFYKSSKKDPLWMRTLVWSVFIIETANTAFDMWYMYEPLILKYGGVPDNLPTVFITQPLCVILVGFPIQLFFIWRIRTLTQNNIIPAVILLFSFVALGGGVWTTVMVPIVAKFRNIPRLYRSAEVWLISSAVTDLCIALTLAVALRSKKTGFAVTDTVVDKIIRMTVQTGMLTALFSILDVICFLTLQGVTVNFIWNIPLSKLYSNCLLSTLNARQHLNHNMNGHQGGSSGRQANVVLSGPTYATQSLSKVNQDTTTFGQDTTINQTDSQYGIQMTKVVERV
ncbi:hypothetical protein MVEN_02170700 [Mycena venus]|uniref:DUF6534 domain-containing protein n=1 Tax=Mycena venus TaxID=2733690 RepID=A0A8H6X7Y2_9AGAR|nr:hypothetical protein MVEN_02170700 [Mycena venus]